MTTTIDIRTYIDNLQSGEYVLLDVRSPGEYQQGHIPGALNLPLLNDEERRIVGITYKEKGHQDAVKKGFGLVGHKFIDYIHEAEKISQSRPILLYCWRGGLRSNIMAWALDLAGLSVGLLHGGYKSYRHFCLEQFGRERDIVLISGKTGSSKTGILQALLDEGEHAIDLEGLACHKGSAFGSLGQLPQPTQEQFENDLAWALMRRPEALTWLENESRFIGRIRIPDVFFDKMSSARAVEIERSTEERIELILKDYGKFPVDVLRERTISVAKRMGGDKVKKSVAALDAGDMRGWLMPLLEYYDKTYSHSRSTMQISESVAVNGVGITDRDVAKKCMRLLNPDSDCII